MRRNRSPHQTLIMSMLILASAAAGFAAAPVKFDKSQLVGGALIKQYCPEYPVEARAWHQTGKGIFILNINEKTGQVTSIKIQKSTGHRVLDVSCLQALIEWRFKPHLVTKVWLPITFSMSR
jgi:TonB family protein